MLGLTWTKAQPASALLLGTNKKQPNRLTIISICVIIIGHDSNYTKPLAALRRGSGPRSAACPRRGDGCSSLLAAPTPLLLYSIEGGSRKTSTFLYFSLPYYLFIHLYYIPPPFYLIPLTSYYTLSPASGAAAVTRPRPLDLTVYQCFAPNLITPSSVYIRACRRAAML